MAIPGNQIKHIMRRLRRSPMFTAITLVTLAIGIGANTAVFSVIEGVLLKPLPYAAPDEFVGVWLTAPGIGIKDVNMSPSSYFIFRAYHARARSGAPPMRTTTGLSTEHQPSTAITWTPGVPPPLRGVAAPQRAACIAVTPT